jgi:hypothetical protein
MLKKWLKILGLIFLFLNQKLQSQNNQQNCTKHQQRQLKSSCEKMKKFLRKKFFLLIGQQLHDPLHRALCEKRFYIFLLSSKKNENHALYEVEKFH